MFCLSVVLLLFFVRSFVVVVFFLFVFFWGGGGCCCFFLFLTKSFLAEKTGLCLAVAKRKLQLCIES